MIVFAIFGLKSNLGQILPFHQSWQYDCPFSTQQIFIILDMCVTDTLRWLYFSISKKIVNRKRWLSRICCFSKFKIKFNWCEINLFEKNYPILFSVIQHLVLHRLLNISIPKYSDSPFPQKPLYLQFTMFNIDRNTCFKYFNVIYEKTRILIYSQK